MDYSYAKIIQSDAKYHPVLFSESPWNFRNKREQLTELMFEKYDVPAYFLVKNAVLAAFANGKATGVVIDSGSTHTSSVPVQDGFVLKHAMATTSLGGDYISMECRQFLHVSTTIFTNNFHYLISRLTCISIKIRIINYVEILYFS